MLPSQYDYKIVFSDRKGFRGIPLITVTLSHGHTKIWNLLKTNFKTKIDNRIQKGICDIAKKHEGKLNGDYFPYFSAKLLFEIVPWT